MNPPNPPNDDSPEEKAMPRKTKAEKQAEQDRADAAAIRDAVRSAPDILSPRHPANRAAMAEHERQAHGGGPCDCGA